MSQQNICLQICCLVLFLSGGLCTEGDSGSSSGATAALPSWVIGIIAVAVFLVLTFIFLMAEPYMCQSLYVDDYDEETPLERLNGNGATDSTAHKNDCVVEEDDHSFQGSNGRRDLDGNSEQMTQL